MEFRSARGFGPFIPLEVGNSYRRSVAGSLGKDYAVWRVQPSLPSAPRRLQLFVSILSLGGVDISSLPARSRMSRTPNARQMICRAQIEGTPKIHVAGEPLFLPASRNASASRRTSTRRRPRGDSVRKRLLAARPFQRDADLLFGSRASTRRALDILGGVFRPLLRRPGFLPRLRFLRLR